MLQTTGTDSAHLLVIAARTAVAYGGFLLAWRVAGRRSLTALAAIDWLLLGVLLIGTGHLLDGVLSRAASAALLSCVAIWHFLHAWRIRARRHSAAERTRAAAEVDSLPAAEPGADGQAALFEASVLSSTETRR
jgi:hypothetical protein